MILSEESQRKLAFIASTTRRRLSIVDVEAIIAKEYERVCTERYPGVPLQLIARFELAWENQEEGIQYLRSLSR